MQKCKLNKSITNATINTEGDGCSLNGFINGGIQDGIYVYNIEDIENLIFSGDSRYDDNLFVETVVTSHPFYQIDATSLSYSENYNDGKWEHSLSGNITNISVEVERILKDSVNGKYLVCFLPKGEKQYRCFGWKNGSSLDYSVSMSNDSANYTITFEDTSEYPLMGLLSDNFTLKDKTFEPNWTRSEEYYCELENGENNGYKIFKYILKVNSSGQALDSNNKLCYLNFTKQVAYKQEDQPDANYDIWGTYQGHNGVKGIYTFEYDLESCPLPIENPFDVQPNDVKLNSTTTSATLSVTSSEQWQIVGKPSFITVSSTQGDGSMNILVTGNKIGGCGTIVFWNQVTKEQKLVSVQENIIKANDEYVYDNGTRVLTIKPKVLGCNTNYTAVSSVGDVTINLNNSFTLSNIPVSENEQNITVTLTHSSDNNEQAIINIKILGNNTDATYVAVREYCADIDW